MQPEKAREIKEFFRLIKPYSRNQEMFKVKEGDEGTSLEGVLLYGVSAKEVLTSTMRKLKVK